jgi:hypothetical protein
MESNKVTAADLTLHIESEGLKEPFDGRIKRNLQNVSSCGAESLSQWVRVAAIAETLRGAVDEAAVLGKKKPRWDEGKAGLRDGGLSNSSCPTASHGHHSLGLGQIKGVPTIAHCLPSWRALSSAFPDGRPR